MCVAAVWLSGGLDCMRNFKLQYCKFLAARGRQLADIKCRWCLGIYVMVRIMRVIAIAISNLMNSMNFPKR